jgi:hypothetical protein
MVISISLTDLELEAIDALAKEAGETRSAYLVRRAKGADGPPSRRQLAAIAKRVRETIVNP